MLIGIAQFLLVTAIAFGAFVLIASHLRFQRLTRAAAEPDAPDASDADPLTAEAAHRLGTAHREPEPFAVILFEPAAAAGQSLPDDLEPLLQSVDSALRGNIRAGDGVLRHGSRQIGALLWITRDRAEPVAQRLLERIRRPGDPGGRSFPPGIHVAAGIATHPGNGSRTHALLRAAHEALDNARAAADWTTRLAAADLPAVPLPASVAAPKGILDELTGVLKEDRLVTALQRSLSRHRKEGRPLSLLHLDLDHLDRYNEHYGRETGDALLKGMAAVLQKHARETDLIGRLEGDSFLLIMDCAADRAMPATQRLLGELRKTPFAVPGGSLRISASVGVAGYPDQAAHPRDLARAARYALRAAKRRGGGRPVLFEPAMQTIAEENPREVDTL